MSRFDLTDAQWARIAAYFGSLAAEPATSTAAIHAGWITFVALLTYGWVFSYFWSAATQIYLLLRHDVDGAAFDDIALPEHAVATSTPEPPGTPGPSPVEIAPKGTMTATPVEPGGP